MPELPDVAVYVEALERRVVGHRLEEIRLSSPFVLRTVVPPIAAAQGRRVTGVRRLGKRIVIALEGEIFLVLHLMIAGRLRWLARGTKPPARITLATFAFDTGVLAFTEAGTRKRASLHLVEGPAALAAFDRGGAELDDIDAAAFAARLKQENHTLKRALTDPRLFSGIGNAYSDEILHRARLSPLALTHKLSTEETERLFASAKAVLAEWTERLRREAGEDFPERRHRVPAADGGAWPLRQAVPGLRRAGAAHCLRRQRNQLLRALPDPRHGARRSRVVALVESELATLDRRARLSPATDTRRLAQGGLDAPAAAVSQEWQP